MNDRMATKLPIPHPHEGAARLILHLMLSTNYAPVTSCIGHLLTSSSDNSLIAHPI